MRTEFSGIRLETERLVLRRYAATDAEAYFETRTSAELLRFWFHTPYTEVSQAERAIAFANEELDSNKSIQLGIELKSSQRVIGSVSLFAIFWESRRAEIGYILDENYHGQGYMNEALTALVNFAFDTLDLNRLEADIDPRNEASRRTLERLGFQLEGHMRERWIVNGVVSDTDFYGLLKRDWDATPLQKLP